MKTKTDYRTFFKNEIEQIEAALESFLPSVGAEPSTIHEAMRYAVLNGGKRFRPLLVLLTCEIVGGNFEKSREAAVAFELIHSYSLVHDDLPALDNDDLRRGKPSVHKQFGEAMAVLTGDALLTLAFEIASRIQGPMAIPVIRELAAVSGSQGMIGGQVADIEAVSGELSLAMLDFISVHKTGKLIKGSAVAGALSAGASDEELKHLTRFGESLGLAFQMVDDVLDGDGYLHHMKASEAAALARDLIANSKKELKMFGQKADKLLAICDFLLERMEVKHVV